METTVLTLTIVLIGLGVLVKRFPILIAGYNTMSKEEKRNVDVKGLSTFMCYSLVGMGAVTLFAYYACLGVGHADWASYCLFLPVLYIPYLIIKANQFDHNPPKKSRKYVIAISLFTIALISVFMIYGMAPATIKVKGDKLVFTGLYGTSRSLGEIASVRLADSLPDITLRLNGMSMGGTNKGWFKLRAGGSCLLFLSSCTRPYIVFTERSGKEIFFNSKSAEITKEIYVELSQAFTNKK